MPLEVREIGIRFSVESEDAREESPPGEGGASPGLGARERQGLVEECVRAVLDVLRRRGER